MECRSCVSQQVSSIFSFGHIPLANRLLQAQELALSEPRVNLEIVLCCHCGLVQLKDIIEPEVLFDEYHYFSSNSDDMIQSAAKLVAQNLKDLPKNAKIIEIASNDGYLLQHYLNKDVAILGIEPAKNIAKFAQAKGIPTLCEYFGLSLAQKIVSEQGGADIIHANNVMAHVPNINDFAAGIKTLLKPEGTAIIEVPYLVDLINHIEFDTIYHEHIYYFSVTALNYLFTKHQLLITDVEKIPLHGGSLRLYVKHASGHTSSNNVKKFLENETAIGITQSEFYKDFSTRINALKEKLVALLQQLKAQGKKIAAYGASAKGTTLLNFFNIDNSLIDFVVDRSPHKQGFYTPGTHLPIYATDLLLKQEVDYALLLTWNFADEILKQQHDFRTGGGKFIIPIPNVEVV